jgi:hypothetical protein
VWSKKSSLACTQVEMRWDQRFTATSKIIIIVKAGDCGCEYHYAHESILLCVVCVWVCVSVCVGWVGVGGCGWEGGGGGCARAAHVHVYMRRHTRPR